MKLGTFLAILILVLVSLGFLINDSIHTHSELSVAKKTMTTLQNENSELAQRVILQANEIHDLQTQYNALSEQNGALTNHNTELKSKIQTLSTDLSFLRAQNEILHQISSQLASDTNSPLVNAALVLAVNKLPTGKTMFAASFLPIFIVGSGFLTYRLYSYGRKKILSNTHTYMIRVSERERKAIIRHRRSN
jgi:cell division protein FtsB